MKAGFKQTEVGEIPEDWTAVNLESIADIDPDNLPSSTPADFSFNYIALEDVDVGFLRKYSAEVFCSAPSRARRRLLRGDILVSTVRPNLKSHLFFLCNGGRWVCSTGFSVVRCKKDMSIGGYVFSHLFTSNVAKQIEALLTGSNYPAINRKDVCALCIPLPPTLAEQEAIASALGDADALIESLERLIAKKRDVKQGAMQELLTARRRLPGFTGKWETKRLGTVSEMGSGGTPSSSVPAYYDGDIPWVSISDMTKTGKVIMSTDRNISRAGFTNSAAQMFPAGTVLYAMYASLGECCIAGISLCSSQAILGIRPHDILDKEFLFYFLSSIKSDVKTLGQQGTQANLNKGMVQDFLLCLPSRSEQAAITAVLSDMDAEIAALEAKLSKARAIKQGMMQELLTGRIRLK